MQLVSEQKTSRQSLSGKPADGANMKNRAVKVDIPDIVSVSACADLTLPPGAGLSIDTISGPVYLVVTSLTYIWNFYTFLGSFFFPSGA